MDYIEVTFEITPLHPFDDILTTDLAGIGFESFINSENGLLAYIQENDFKAEKLKSLIQQYNNGECKITYEQKVIPSQNWNAAWESNFEPIEVDGICIVRAPFHQKNPSFKYDLLIEPKMSFGTGHHETTYLMLQQLLHLEVKNKAVLDMGCGTSVLALLAAKLEAKSILAIDNDSWSYENSLENCALNNCLGIEVKLGDASLLNGRSFDLILANINRNILMQDMAQYVAALNPKGELLISGFFDVDASSLIEHAKTLGLQLKQKLVKNSWALIHFQIY